jgi:hypothetical protein
LDGVEMKIELTLGGCIWYWDITAPGGGYHFKDYIFWQVSQLKLDCCYWMVLE